MVGLLTYPILECLPRATAPVAKSFKDTYGTYSSGSVQDSHLIPFSSHHPCGGIVNHKSPQWYMLFLSLKNCSPDILIPTNRYYSEQSTSFRFVYFAQQQARGLIRAR